MWPGADGSRVGDEGDDTHVGAAERTHDREDFVDAGEQPRPAVAGGASVGSPVAAASHRDRGACGPGTGRIPVPDAKRDSPFRRQLCAKVTSAGGWLDL